MIRVLQGDCRNVLATLEADSIEACFTDPPYGLEFMNVAWDTFATPKGGARTSNTWGDHGLSRPKARRASAGFRRNTDLSPTSLRN
jgi:DNA modification methylase